MLKRVLVLAMVIASMAAVLGCGGSATPTESGNSTTPQPFATATPVPTQVGASNTATPSASGASSPGIGDPVPQSILAHLTSIPTSVFDTAGAKDATAPTFQGAATSTSTSTPELLYMGSEFCPFCAAQRWVLVTGLSRFGTWSGLELSKSASTKGEVFPDTPTLTFKDASFNSPYLRVATVEMQGRTIVNGQYPIVQTPTASQMATIRKFDSAPYVSAQYAGAIPFVLLNRQYVWAGASYSPQLLSGGTWQSIAQGISDGSTKAGKAILENANLLSAAICATDGGQPSSVCQSAGVKAAAALLNKSG